MATYQGNAGVLKIADGSGDLNAIAEIKSFTVELSQDVNDVTVMGNGARTFKGGLETGTITAEVLYTAQEVLGGDGVVVNALAMGSDPVDFEVYPFGDTAGNTKISGKIMINSYSVNASFDDMVNATISGNLSGTTTIATA